MAFLDFSAQGVVYAFSEIVGAPFKNPEILWFSLPLLATLIVIELNVRKGGQGLKQAIPNAIVLLFISLDLFRIAFKEGSGFFSTVFSIQMAYPVVVLALSVLMILMEYKWHVFPNETLFGITLHLPINTFAYIMMIMVYNKIQFTLNTIFGMIIFMAILLVLFFVVSRLEPKPTDYSGKRQMDPFSPKRTREVEVAEKKSQNPAGSGDVDMGSGKLVWIKKDKK